MKNKKYILCGGLAFSDNKDMELLHMYALEGWIFREIKFGVFYVLHKEAPSNLIFSYDIQKVKPEDKDDYLALFKEGGWTSIGKWDSSLHFFCAKEKTTPLHSERAIRNEQYHLLLPVCVGMLVLAGVFALLAYLYHFIWFSMLAGALLGGGVMLTIGYLRRKKGLEGNWNTRTYRWYLIELIIGILNIIIYFKVKDEGLIMLFVLIIALCFIFGALHGFYILKKENAMKARIK